MDQRLIGFLFIYFLTAFLYVLQYRKNKELINVWYWVIAFTPVFNTVAMLLSIFTED